MGHWTWLILASAVATACAPAWDWRSLRIAGTPVTASFPCRPASQARDVDLAGQRLRLTLQACSDHDTLFAVGWVPVADPAQVGAVLAALRGAAAANLRAAPAPLHPFTFAGATPNVQSGRQAFVARAPDGRELKVEVAVFAVGTTAFQATVIATAPEAQAVSHFFGALGLAPAPAGGPD